MPAVTWLHLTDLHIGTEATRQNTIQSHFFEDLETVCQELGPIDLVLFTGDLVQKGAKAEFQRADEFVQRLLKVLEVRGSVRPVFLAVPGNHDLERPKPVRVEQLVRWEKETEADFWNDNTSPSRKQVECAFQNYEAWWAGYRNLYAEKYKAKAGLLPGDFRCTFEKAAVKIGIVGLNTAFLQLTDDEQLHKLTKQKYEGRLVVSAQQYQGFGEEGRDWAKRHDLCLLLTHHPVAWLSKDCAKEFNQDIYDPEIFAAHLSGHMHVARYWRGTEGGGRQRRSLQGKSLFGYDKFHRITDNGATETETRMHGYAIGRVQFKENVATLRVWPRRAWEPGESWKFGPDYESYRLGGDVRAQHTDDEDVSRRDDDAKSRKRQPSTQSGAGKEPSMSLLVKQKRAIQVEGMPPLRGSVDLSDISFRTVQLFRKKLVEKKLDKGEQQLLGELLFHALFNGEVRERFEETLTEIPSGGRLRLHLNFGEAGDLAGLPWEYMYHTRRDNRAGYLCSDVDISLSRQCLGKPPETPVSGPLTIFLVIPKPKDPVTVGRGTHAFDESEVLSHLRQLVQPTAPDEHSRFGLVTCESPTRSKYVLQVEALTDDYMLHFIGYARLRGEGKEEEQKVEVAFLEEENEQPDWHWMSEDDFVQVFQQPGATIPRLVFLQLYDCPARHIASLAQKLITIGVPFVVAMQHPIPNDPAQCFSKTFYQTLAKQRPVAEAVQAGRSDIARKCGNLDIGTPVIYLSADSSLLGASESAGEGGTASRSGRVFDSPSNVPTGPSAKKS